MSSHLLLRHRTSSHLLLLLLLSLLSLLTVATTATTAITTPTNNNTVLAWIEGNWTEVANFILHGNAKGAVNAISAGGMWGVSSIDGSLVVNEQRVQDHRNIWQSKEAKEAGIRTYPVIGFGGNITVLRQLFDGGSDKFIQDVCNEMLSLGVDGVNIDFEPIANVRDKHDPVREKIELFCFVLFVRLFCCDCAVLCLLFVHVSCVHAIH